LLVHLALHAAFQHGLVLSLVQWLDVRRVLERLRPDPLRLREIARAMGAEAAVVLALQAAADVVQAPWPASFDRPGTGPRDPLTLVTPSAPSLASVRWA